jgi:structure-specific recognition protein 1
MNKDGLGWRSKEGSSITVVGSELSAAKWVRIGRYFQLRLEAKNGTTYKFDGFREPVRFCVTIFSCPSTASKMHCSLSNSPPIFVFCIFKFVLLRNFVPRVCCADGSLFWFGSALQDFAQLKEVMPRFFGIQVTSEELSTKGWNWGAAKTQGNTVSFAVEGKTAFEIPMGEISNIQSAKQEVVMEFHHDDTTDDRVASLVELRFHIPKVDAPEDEDKPEGEQDEAEEEKDVDDRTTADKFVDEILSRADLVSTGGKSIVDLEAIVAAPRGRFTLSFFPGFFKMKGQSRDYKINYSSVVRLFQMPKADGQSVYFVLSLAQAVRGVGNTSHQHIVMMLPEDEVLEVDLNWPEAERNDELQQRLGNKQEGPSYEVIARLFKTLTQKKVTIPKGFKNAHGSLAVKCWYGSNEGHLYPFERSFLFVHKPAMHIRFDEVADVEFARVGESGVKGSSGNRTFDLIINMRQGKPVQFQNLQRSDYAPLFNFLNSKKIRIANFEDMPQPAPPVAEHDDAADDNQDDEEAARRMIASQRRAELASVETKSKREETPAEEEAAGDDGDNIASRRSKRRNTAAVQEAMRQEILSGRAGGDDEESEEDNDFSGAPGEEEESEEDDEFDDEEDEETPKKKKKAKRDDADDGEGAADGEKPPKKKKVKADSDDE